MMFHRNLQIYCCAFVAVFCDDVLCFVWRHVSLRTIRIEDDSCCCFARSINPLTYDLRSRILGRKRKQARAAFELFARFA